MLTANRRSFATLIRVQQELRKRAERLYAPRGRDSQASLAREWRPVSARGELLAASRAALPLPWFADVNSGPQHPTASALVANADRICDGQWRLFAFEIVDTPVPRWRVHPKTGNETPAVHFSRVPYLGSDDVKYVWELNRHHGLLRLAQAYSLTHDERYAERLTTLIDSWIADNPADIGINWAAALEVAFRAIVWTWLWRLTAHSAHWTTARFARVLSVQQAAGRYLEHYDSVHHSPNTHLTGEALGLFYLGTCWPQLHDASRWRKRGLAILSSEVPHQLLADGFHYERATGYHRYTLEFYLHAFALMSPDDPAREPLKRAVIAAASASRHLQMPSGEWPVIGDEDGGLAVPLAAGDTRDQAQLLVLAASLLRDPHLRPAYRVEGDDALSRWFGVTPMTGHEPAERSASLASAGYHVVRVGAEPKTYCLVDAGPHGGLQTGHAHTDLGHIELVMHGHRVWVDPGCPVYGSDVARREHFRSLAAHASLMVDREPLATTRGPFGWRSVAPTPDVVVHDADGQWSCILRYPIDTPSGAVHHERIVTVIDANLVVVCDRLHGVGTHDVQWCWPLGETAEREVSLNGGALRIADTVGMAWTTQDAAGVAASLAASLVPCFTSPTYGEVRDSQQLRVSGVVALPLFAITVVAAHLESIAWRAADQQLDIALRDGLGSRRLEWIDGDLQWRAFMSADEVHA